MSTGAEMLADESMCPIERVRCALAMADAGYSFGVDIEDVEGLLAAYDRLAASAPAAGEVVNVELASKLELLCCAETEGKFFDLVTDNIQTILAALRRPTA